MKINIQKLTNLDLLRRANEFTTDHESRMSLATAYRLGHSPIRTQLFWVELREIPLFVASQLVRQHVGVQFFQKSHRPDRNPDAKDEGRMTPTDLVFICNAEALINMAHKRLCGKASAETREVVRAICEAPAEQVGGDHYRRMKIDVFDFAEANGLTFMEATVCEYICRHRFKNGKEDLLKAQHAINILIQHYYGNQD